MKSLWFLYLLIIFLSLSFYSCKPNTIEEIKKVSEQDTFPIAVINNAEVYYSDSGTVTMHILAPIIRNYLYPNEITILEGKLKGNFYDSIGRVQSVINCDFAKLDDKNGIVELRKNVKVFNVMDETEFYSEELIWNRREHNIKSNKFIRIITPDKIIWGDGFLSDEELKNYKILKPKGEIHVNEI
jgi:LPS export ABC transporter protein LptC